MMKTSHNFIFISYMIALTLGSGQLDGQYKVNFMTHGGTTDQNPTVKAYFNTAFG